MASSVERVLAERKRHLEEEGWSPAHDDRYQHGELVRAAYSYLLMASDYFELDPSSSPPPHWPWNPEWWKPCSPERALEKAGSLILAELDRLARQAQRTTESPKKEAPTCQECFAEKVEIELGEFVCQTEGCGSHGVSEG